MQVKNPSAPSLRAEGSNPVPITYPVGIIFSRKINDYMPFGHSMSTGLLRSARNDGTAQWSFNYLTLTYIQSLWILHAAL